MRVEGGELEPYGPEHLEAQSFPHPIEVVPGDLADYFDKGGEFTPEVVDGLILLGASPEDIGRFAQRRAVPLISLMRAIKPMTQEVRVRSLKTFKYLASTRPLARLHDECYARAAALIPLARGSGREILREFCEAVEAAEGRLVRDPELAAEVAEACNKEGIPLSCVAVALAARGVSARTENCLHLRHGRCLGSGPSTNGRGER